MWRSPFSLVNLAVSFSVLEFSQKIFARIGCIWRSYRQVSSRLLFARIIGVFSGVLSGLQQRERAPRRSKMMILFIIVCFIHDFYSMC